MTADTPTPKTPIEGQLANLQVVDKLKNIPMLEHAYNTSAGVYSRVKGSNLLVNWALQSAEGVIGTAVGIVTPVANKFPISEVDAQLCKGIDLLEEKVPIVKDQPEEIYNKAKGYVNGIQTVTMKFADQGWCKANDILNSRYGSMALSGLDTTSQIADKYIDYYLPPLEGEEEIHPHPNTECDDKVLHTLHTVGALSNKMGGRVYRSLSNRFSGQRQL